MNSKEENKGVDVYKSFELEAADTFDDYISLVTHSCKRPEIILKNFPRFARTAEINKFIVDLELYRKIIEIHGSIIEIGVLEGFNLFTLAHFAEIFEHRNYTRTIYGFDTFEGYKGIDPSKDPKCDYFKGLPATDSYNSLVEAVQAFNRSVTVAHTERINLIKGNVLETLPEFLDKHPELTVSLLLLQCGLYKPTATSLELLYSRIPKGGVVAFGTLNFPDIPGETVALLEKIGIGGVSLKRFPFARKMAYFIKE